MELEPDPRLEAAAAAKRAKKLSRTPDVPCPKCTVVCRSKAELQEHTVEKHPTGLFTLDKQDQYLELLVQGDRRHLSARQIGLTPAIVERFIKLNPAYERAVVMAEEEYAERVEKELYKAALGGEPWAVKEVLSKRSAKRWGTPDQNVNVNVNHSGTISAQLEIEAGPRAARIAEIEARLHQRALMSGEIIDAEVVEDVPES